MVQETRSPINAWVTLDPSGMRATREAFEAAARALGCSCGGRPATLPREVQVRLSRSIVECARSGERDVDVLRDFALASVAAYASASPNLGRQLGHQHVGGWIIQQRRGDAAPDRANDAGSPMRADDDQIGTDATAFLGDHFGRCSFPQHARQ